MTDILLTRKFDCPHFHRPVEMSVQYVFVESSSPSREYKRGVIHDSDCNFYEACPLKDEWDRCPVFLKFPQPYHET